MKYTRAIKILSYKFLFFILTIAISTFFWRHTWEKRNIQAIPNPDIFQYIGDGYQYLSFKLPASIHPPPLAPIMIVSVAKVISKYTTYPEVAAAHLINISLSSLAIILIYLLVATFTTPFRAFLLSLLVATNQIYILYSQDITNEVSYTFFLVLSLYLYKYFKHPVTYFFIGFIFLLRYESIVLPIAIFIVEYFSKKRQLKLKNIFYSFLPIVSWLVILHFHSKGGSLVENAYLVEIWNGLKNIPNLLSFTSLVEIMTFDKSYPSNLNYLFGVVTVYLCYRGATKKTTPIIAKISYLVFGFHLLFLYVFPNFAVRYYIPIIWITYLIITYHKSTFISFTIFSILLTYNIARIDKTTNYSRPLDMSEYRQVATWLNETNFTRPTTVVIFEPHILRYYVKNPLVDVRYDFETPFYPCQDKIVCIGSTLSSASSSPDVLFVVTAYSTNQQFDATDKFTAALHHVNVFDEKTIYQDKIHFKYQNTVGEAKNWANIYKYLP